MKTISYRVFLGMCMTLFVHGLTFAQESVWRPVTQAELDLKTSTVEPDADAEAIFWEVRLDDKKLNKLSYDHYVRVKIFTVRGREQFAKMDIPFMKGKKVEDVAARVTKPDGMVIDLKPEDIFEREIAKAGKSRILAKSFAVPGIDPGAIVEFQYKETFKNDTADGERLIFQRDIPMQKVSYYMRPGRNLSASYTYFNMPNVEFVPDRDGFYVATMTNVPAYKVEPYMPPDDEVRRWTYVSYPILGTFVNWRVLATRWSSYAAELSKPNKEIRQKAAELTANAGSDDEKLKRIYYFVQRQIRNMSFDRTLTPEEREKADVKGVDDALKRRMGSAMFIDLLFASLAQAAGYEANIVLVGDRSENFFTPERYPFPRFIQPGAIAVRVGNEWQYFNPGTPFLPFGHIIWTEEGVNAMIVQNSGYSWTKIPLSDHLRSKTRRTGTFLLQEDGTLSGRVKIEYYGHQAISRRRDEYFDSPAKREENLKTEIKSRIRTAEVSAISIENFDDNDKPLTYTYAVKVPNYAQKTGKRLFLQPGYFRYGIGPLFSSETRTTKIYFPYPWSEEDDVEIKLPETMIGESVVSPPPVVARPDVASLQITITTDNKLNTLRMNRRFHFGGGGNILFEPKFYKPIKALFDSFNKLDTHTVTFRQK